MGEIIPEWWATSSGISKLTDRHESGRENRWHVSDAPFDCLDDLFKGIVCVRIIVKRMEGQWKVSQNRSAADSVTVAHGLGSGGPGEAEMARHVAERSR